MKFFKTFILLISISFFSYANKQDRNIQRNLEKASIYLNQFNFDSAFVFFNTALQAAKSKNDKVLETHITRLMGRAYILASNSDSALIQLTRAIDMAKLIDNDSILAMAYLNVAYILINRGMADSALWLHKEALRLYESNNDSIGMAKAHTSLAIYYKYSGDFDLGLKNALSANYIFRKLKLEAPLARSYINLGNTYEKIGDYDTAVSCFEKSYQIGQKINNPDIISTSLINKTVVYWQRANEEMEKGDSITGLKMYQLTKDEFLKSIEYSKKINDLSALSMLYSNISIVYNDLGMFKESIESAKKAISLSKELNIMTDQLNALNNLGIAYQNMKEYNSAKRSYLESLDLARKSKHKEAIKKACINLSTAYELMGDYKKSLEYARLTAVYEDSLFSESKQKLIEEHKTNFEILHLKDQNQIKELDKKRIRAERNITLGIGILVVVALLSLIIFFRMRARKNRIIAQQRIQKLEDEKKLMAARSVLVGQEKERERIAQELHDGIGVLLSTASIHFSSVESKADAETSEMLKKANKLLKEAGKEVRQISHNMMPGVLSKFGLKEAIEDLFEDIEESTDIEIDLQLTCGEMRLAENMEIMLYRVIQEMLNNTLKHAKASKISLLISRDDNEIFIDYHDNGIGFVEDKLPHEKSLGVSGIRSRIDYLGGTIELLSATDKGTKYAIMIPLSEKIA